MAANAYEEMPACGAEVSTAESQDAAFVLFRDAKTVQRMQSKLRFNAHCMESPKTTGNKIMSQYSNAFVHIFTHNLSHLFQDIVALRSSQKKKKTNVNNL